MLDDPHRLDESITIKLKRDEAIVLFWYLGREVYDSDKNLRASFAHPAEEHGLLALHQELLHELIDTGAPETAGIENAAREHLLKRHT